MEGLIYGVGFVFVYVVLATLVAIIFYLTVRFLMFTITVLAAFAAINLIPSLRLISPLQSAHFFVVMIAVGAIVIAFICDIMAWSERVGCIFDKREL